MPQTIFYKIVNEQDRTRTLKLLKHYLVDRKGSNKYLHLCSHGHVRIFHQTSGRSIDNTNLNNGGTRASSFSNTSTTNTEYRNTEKGLCIVLGTVFETQTMASFIHLFGYKLKGLRSAPKNNPKSLVHWPRSGACTINDSHWYE